MSDERTTPKVVENYSDYNPSFKAAATVKKLLSCVPSHYLNGLEQVVLRNSSGLNRKRRRQKTLSRKKRVAVKKSLGLYHQEWRGVPARIDIFIDNIERTTPSWVFKIPLLRDLFFARIVYHEIGHHIHKTVHPKYQEREDVADEWSKKLARLFINKKYWYLKPLVYIIGKSIKAVKKMRSLYRK